MVLPDFPDYEHGNASRRSRRCTLGSADALLGYTRMLPGCQDIGSRAGSVRMDTRAGVMRVSTSTDGGALLVRHERDGRHLRRLGDDGPLAAVTVG